MKKRGVAIIVAVVILIGGIVAGANYATIERALQAETPPQLGPGPEPVNPEEIDENTPPEVVEELKRGGLIDESGKPIPQPKIPTLTQEEKAWAKEIALSDPRVRELIEGKNYEVSSIGVIHTTLKEGLEKIGAVVIINFDKSYDIEYDWPIIEPVEGTPEHTPEKWSDYRQSTVHGRFIVKSLNISIFFDEGKVVRIIPNPTMVLT